MKQETKDGASVAPDIEQVRADILALTRDLAELIDKMKTAALDGSSEALHDSASAVGDKARSLYGKVAAQGERSAQAVGRQVEAQPVLSLLIAFAIGFCASRLIAR